MGLYRIAAPRLENAQNSEGGAVIGLAASRDWGSSKEIVRNSCYKAKLVGTPRHTRPYDLALFLRDSTGPYNAARGFDEDDLTPALKDDKIPTLVHTGNRHDRSSGAVRIHGVGAHNRLAGDDHPTKIHVIHTGYAPVRREGNLACVIAGLYAATGENDKALEWLERMYAKHDSSCLDLKVDPRLDNLRSSHRFQVLLARMNFPDE